MIRITHEIADKLSEECMSGEKLGCVTEFGAVIGDAEFVLYYPDDGPDVFLAHVSEFEQQGVCIRLKINR
jgi:hypothetical protein